MLEDWEKGNQPLKYLNDKLSVFEEFAKRELLLEPIEEIVHGGSI